nr:retrotransposon protein, putative, unclassified [Tanacetum cinerariifolium]
PEKVIQALTDPSWIKAIQDELQQVWTLVDLPYGKRDIRTKWIYKNKKDKRGIVVRNKARLVAQGYTQEEGIDYDEVFVPVARIKAIRLFLAYESFKNFVVYQMDAKSAFLYGKIEEKVYVCQPPGFEDPKFLGRVYKAEKALYGLHQAPKACQDKYVDEILKKFGFSTMKTTSTPMETLNPLMKDENAEDVDVHLYRSMIGSLIYLTSSRPDIMFVDSPFDLEAYTGSDYAGASLNRKSTKGDCKFLRSRLISWQCKKQTVVANSTIEEELISWQCKKQTVVANSTIEEEYVAASNCCRQLLWIQNQMLDYGYNFMNTKIFIDNESTIFRVKNPVFHSKTKHIEIRHHFIRDSYKKRLIQMIKIHTDHNVADLLIKAFDAYNYYCQLKVNLAMHTLTTADDEQFWTTTKAKNINGEAQIHAKVDGKKRVKRLEKKRKSRTHGLKRLYKVGQSARVELSAKQQSLGEEDASKQGRNIADIDADAETTLVNETAKDQGRYNDEEMFDTDVLNDEEVVVEDVNVASIATFVTAAATTAFSIDDITLAQALVEIKTSKPKARGIIMQEPSEIPITTTVTPLFVKKTLCHNLGVSSKHS